MHIEEPVLRASLAGLRGLDPASGDVAETLHRVVDATRGLFSVTGAGLMIVDASSVLRYVVATDEPGRLLEQAQERAGRGPCVDALVHDRVVASSDLADDERWPEVSAAVVPAGVRAVLGVPTHVGGGPVGSLNVYRHDTHDWDASDRDAIVAFARVIEDFLAIAVLRQRDDELVQQLQYALDHRVTIERAVGVVMGRDGVDAVEAFEQLRRLARNRRVKVARVAAEILDPERRPS